MLRVATGLGFFRRDNDIQLGGCDLLSFSYTVTKERRVRLTSYKFLTLPTRLQEPVPELCEETGWWDVLTYTDDLADGTRSIELYVEANPAYPHVVMDMVFPRSQATCTLLG